METFCRDITLTLLHSFWLAGLAAIFLFLAMQILGRHRSTLRYILSIFTLLTVAISVIFTYRVVSITDAEHASVIQKNQAKPHVVQSIPAISDETQESSTAVRSPAAPSAQDDAVLTTESPSILAENANLQAFSVPEYVYPIAFWGWIAGVLLMYYRILRSLLSLRRFSDSCRPLTAGKLDDLVREVALQVGMKRRFEVFLTETAIPSTMGFFRPILLLPISMTTGYTDNDLRCIIAHELVHIRHYDCLINFVQLLMEGVLFFNPAVWWIGRQIRLERELCCDQVALRYSESRVGYIELVCRFLHLPSLQSLPPEGQPLAASFSKPGKSDALFLRRVRRLALPKDRAKFRMPWLSMLLVMLATGVVMAGISKGVDPGARLVAKLLSPKERIEAIQKLETKYGQVNFSDCPKKEWPVISGTIKTNDGSPLPKQIQVVYHSKSGNSSTVCSVNGILPRRNPKKKNDTPDYTLPDSPPINRIDDAGFFSYAVQPGKVMIIFEAKGYAPVATESKILRPNQRADGIELVLTKGSDRIFQITDADGNPIEGARLSGGFGSPNASFSVQRQEVSGRNGKITLTHSPVDMWFRFSVTAKGYQSISDHFLLSQDNQSKPHQVVMTKALPLTGCVLNKAGKPVAGAKFSVLMVVKDWPTQTAKTLATTDSDGRFVIDQLMTGAEYLFLIQSKEYGSQLFRYTHDGAAEVDITMKQEKIVGRIVGDLDLLPRQDGKPCLRYSYSKWLPGHENCSGKPHFVPVRIEGDEGRFEINDITGNKIQITNPKGVLDGPTSGFVEQFIGHDVVLTLQRQEAATTIRKVILHFVTPEGSPPAEGNVCLSVPQKRNGRYENRGYEIKNLPVKNGRAELEFPTPGFHLQLNRGQTNLTGYSIPHSKSNFEICFKKDIPAGDTPLELDVQLVPAGMVYGQLLHDKNTVGSCSVTCKTIRSPHGLNSQTIQVDSPSISLGDKGKTKFTLNGLPLGGEYCIIASKNIWSAFAVSEKITLDEAHPIQKIDLTIPKCDATIYGTITDEQGNPLMLPLDFCFTLDKKYGGGGYSSNASLQPGGKFRFEVASNPPGTYALKILPKKDFCPQRVEVKRFDRPISIVMHRGEVVEGVLLGPDQKPLSDITLRAYYCGSRSAGDLGQYEQCHAEGPTDAKGRFRFSNLTKGRQYNLTIDSGYHGPYPYHLSTSQFIANGDHEIRITIVTH